MPENSAETKKDFFQEEIAVLRPPERLKISEWTEKYRVLPPSAAERGQMRLVRTPYLVPIMDACLDPNVESVWICKSAQVAGTECVISVLGYYAHQQPSSCMVVLADEDTAKYISKERIQRMFLDSPDLRALILNNKFNIDEISLKNDSYIALAWASSVAKLASRPMRLLIMDEIDKPGYTRTTTEASPISLGIERTETFDDRKIIGLSTPTGETGNIIKRLNECDVIYDWHVPCFGCGQFQPLRWTSDGCSDFPDGKYLAEDGEFRNVGGVVWEGSSEATEDQINNAKYACGECGALWNTIKKNDAVLKGKMVARKPAERTVKRVGFHVNRLYSLLAKSGDIPKLVEEWIRCYKSGDKKEIQGFINSTLAEPWKDFAGKDRRIEDVLRLKTDDMPGVAPEPSLALIVSADVQENGIWYELRAWDEKHTSWLIKYGFLMKTKGGDDGMAGDFSALRGIVEAKYLTPSKSERIVRICLIDSGYRTSEVYDFCRQVTRAHPTKGMQIKNVPIGYTKVDTYPGTGKLIPGGLQLITFDSTHFKDQLYFMLQVGASDHGAWRLHAETGEDYATHYISETKDEEKGVWIQRSRHPNHLLDCGVLQLVSLQILENQGMLQKLAQEKARREAIKPPKRQPQQVRPALW